MFDIKCNANSILYSSTLTVGQSTFWTSSTKHIKYNILPKKNNNVLERLMKIETKTFWLIGDKRGKIQTGYIIEEINEIFPSLIDQNIWYLDKNLVYENDENIEYKENEKVDLWTPEKAKQASINYGRLQFYIVMGLQEFYKKQEEENKQLKNEINELKKTIEEQNNKINELFLMFNELKNK